MQIMQVQFHFQVSSQADVDLFCVYLYLVAVLDSCSVGFV